MQKIPSLYVRDPDDMAYVLREVNPRCTWVTEGEGQPTVKFDGTCMMLDAHGQWWARHQVRPDKAVPESYIPIETDPVTGKTQGWIPAPASGYKKFLAEALENAALEEAAGAGPLEPGTYELVGPKIGKNPHRRDIHCLVQHGRTPLVGVPTEYDELAEFLRFMNEGEDYLEGIVWHHPDGRMAKIKTKDFPK